MNSRHDSVVYSREPRGPGVELGSPKGSRASTSDATFGQALTPLALRLLASLHRRFNDKRLTLALSSNVPALSIRGEPVWAALFDFVLSICETPRPDRAPFLAPVPEPVCDCQRRLWVDVFAAAEEALSLPSGTVCFMTNDDSFDSMPEILK